MKPNLTKAKLARGEVAYGLLVSDPSPAMVEHAAIAGLDFVRIDCEQGPMTLESVEHMVRAAEAVDVTPIVRIATDAAEGVVQLLNRGVTGILFPHVGSAAEAATAVSHVKFGPEGKRVITGTPGHVRWTLGLERETQFRFANEHTMVICMVESAAGIRNVGEIARVPGVDVVMFGAGDLSQDLGLTGQAAHRDVRDLIRQGIVQARDAGAHVGMTVHDPTNTDLLREYLELGVRMIHLMPGQLIVDAVRRFVAAAR